MSRAALRGSGYGVALADSPALLLSAEAREQAIAVLVDDAMPGSVEAVRRLREPVSPPAAVDVDDGCSIVA